jgi:mannose-1-phosphate guanylyltransferase
MSVISETTKDNFITDNSSFIGQIQPIILCGGSGTRLWPLSTSKIPKQFISLGERGTLLEETIRRVSLVMKKCQEYNYKTFEPILIMNHTHRLPPELSKYESNVIYEDYANDTAVAVTRAAFEIKKRHNNTSVIMLVLPADHYIYNIDAFVRDITDGITHITNDNIVLYGIDPIGPETKYGYIIPSSTGVKFREKPNVSLALELINQNALWNSGIFAAHTDLVLQCIISSKYNIMEWILNPHDGKAPSFDIVVLQEYPNIYAHHCPGWKWSDVGTWDAFTDIPEIKQEMNDSSNIIMSECQNINILNRSQGNVVLIGCQDLFVVVNSSDILIMSNKGDYNNHLKDIATRLSK